MPSIPGCASSEESTEPRVQRCKNEPTVKGVGSVKDALLRRFCAVGGVLCCQPSVRLLLIILSHWWMASNKPCVSSSSGARWHVRCSRLELVQKGVQATYQGVHRPRSHPTQHRCAGCKERAGDPTDPTPESPESPCWRVQWPILQVAIEM